MEVTVCIPVHTPRVKNGVLAKTLSSVWKQTYPVTAVSIAIDHNHEGAAVTRNRALAAVQTDWVVFLDSDDMLRPNFLARLVAHQKETGADVVWPWFKVVHGTDPFPMHFGRQWNPDEPHIFPITTLVNMEFVKKVGGFPVYEPTSKTCLGEDWHFWRAMSREGAKFSHLPEILWEWNHGGGNTGGLPDRW